MKAFRLEPAADHRLDEIFRYTDDRWGTDQAQRYIRDLFSCFAAIARHEIAWRRIPAEFGVDGYYCRHQSHFVYWKQLTADEIAIVSILHERMNQVSRLVADLGD